MLEEPLHIAVLLLQNVLELLPCVVLSELLVFPGLLELLVQVLRETLPAQIYVLVVLDASRSPFHNRILKLSNFAQAPESNRTRFLRFLCDQALLGSLLDCCALRYSDHSFILNDCLSSHL